MQQPIVLLVDDDDDFRSLFGEVLREEGFGVVEAANGVEAIAALENVQPDAMLIDLVMPVMSGWELFDALRRRADVRGTPVVFLSAVPRLAPEGGAMTVAKPLSLEPLTRLIAALHDATSSAVESRYLH
jgi:CheY-like chemotaxis protein